MILNCLCTGDGLFSGYSICHKVQISYYVIIFLNTFNSKTLFRSPSLSIRCESWFALSFRRITHDMFPLVCQVLLIILDDYMKNVSPIYSNRTFGFMIEQWHLTIAKAQLVSLDCMKFQNFRNANHTSLDSSEKTQTHTHTRPKKNKKNKYMSDYELLRINLPLDWAQVSCLAEQTLIASVEEPRAFDPKGSMDQ